MNNCPFLIVVALLFFGGCSQKQAVDIQPNLLDRLEQQVNEYVDSSDTTSLTINFNQVTSFEWDYMFIFGPYIPTEFIEGKIGFEWDSAENLITQIGDTHSLIVFTKGEKVVKYLKYPNNIGDFKKIDNTGPYPTEISIFLLEKERYGGEDWLFFYHSPPNISE